MRDALVVPLVVVAVVAVSLYVWAGMNGSAVLRRMGRPVWRAWVPFLTLTGVPRSPGSRPAPLPPSSSVADTVPGMPTRSVFGAHGPAGGPVAPSRRPPLTEGFPSIVPPGAGESAPDDRAPTFRRSMWASVAADLSPGLPRPDRPDDGAFPQPRPARSAVGRQQDPALDDDDEPIHDTVDSRRRRLPWSLVPSTGPVVRVTRDVVIVGRSPSIDPAHLSAQLVALADETRTVSKTHARLELIDGTWFVEDLGSMNGVVLIADDGEEHELAAGAVAPVPSRFVLGDLEVRLRAESE